MGDSPLVVVGTGGSATRVFARLTEAAGRHMGAHQSEANDALALFRFADKWCRIVYPAWRSGSSIDHEEFASDLDECLEHHLKERPPRAPWGWKQPRSLFMLPALARAFPSLRVIHVVRDGRDIAFGKQSSLKVTGSYTLPESANELPVEVQLAMMWSGPNQLAAEFGERMLGERYLRLRLEDLCADPLTCAGQLAAFAGGNGEIAPEQLNLIVQVPPSLGRWRGQDAMLLGQVSSAADEGLRRFGYA